MTLPNGFRDLNETVYEDGNYSASVKFFGITYTCNYICGEIRITSHERNPRPSSWQFKANVKKVREFFTARITNLGPEHKVKHLELYADTIEAKNHLASLTVEPAAANGGFPKLPDCIEYARSILGVDASQDKVETFGATFYYRWKGY
jgi:hypothetical protein